MIGGADLDNDDNYRWLDRTLVASGYSNWGTGDPDHGNEKYMAIRMHVGAIWGDYSATISKKYVCESGLLL